jgi:hypothetical protein
MWKLEENIILHKGVCWNQGCHTGLPEAYGRVGEHACPIHRAQTGHIGHILWIFLKNTSNILEYAWIYSIFPCRVGAEVLWARRAYKQPWLKLTYKGFFLTLKKAYRKFLYWKSKHCAHALVPLLHIEVFVLEKNQNLNFCWNFKVPWTNCFWTDFSNFG